MSYNQSGANVNIYNEIYNKKHWLYKFLPLSIFFTCVFLAINFINTNLGTISEVNIVSFSKVELIPFLRTIGAITLMLIALLYWFLCHKYSQKLLIYFLIVPFAIYIVIYLLLLGFCSHDVLLLLNSEQVTSMISKYPIWGNYILFYANLYDSIFYIITKVLLVPIMTFIFWSLSVQTVTKNQAFKYFFIFSILGNFILFINNLFFSYINNYVGYENPSYKYISLIIVALLFVFIFVCYNILHKSISKYDQEYANFHLTEYKDKKSKQESILANKYFWIIIGVMFFVSLISINYDIVWKTEVRNFYSIPMEYLSFMGNYSIIFMEVSLFLFVLFVVFSLLRALNWYKITISFVVLGLFVFILSLLNIFLKDHIILYSTLINMLIQILNTIIFFFFPFFVLTTCSKLMQTKGLMLILLFAQPIIKLFLISFNIMTLMLMKIGTDRYNMTIFIIGLVSMICLFMLTRKAKLKLTPLE